MGCCCNEFLKMWKWLWNWVMDKSWKFCEDHDRRGQGCLEQTNMDIKDFACEGSEGSKEHDRESLYCLREYLYCHKQDIKI